MRKQANQQKRRNSRSRIYVTVSQLVCMCWWMDGVQLLPSAVLFFFGRLLLQQFRRRQNEEIRLSLVMKSVCTESTSLLYPPAAVNFASLYC